MTDPTPQAPHPGFSEQSLRQCIVNTWGPAGAHVDVYDALTGRLAEVEGERDKIERLQRAEYRLLKSKARKLAAAEARAERYRAALGRIVALHLDDSHLAQEIARQALREHHD